MIMRILIFLSCLVLGSWISTNWLIAVIAPQAHPAGELFKLGSFAVYAPWMWFKWFYLYGALSKVLFIKTMVPIQVSILVGIILAWLAKLFSKAPAPSTAHGSSKWAEEKDIIAADLFGKQGVILGQTSKGGQILRHNGPEHIMAIAPTRAGKGVGLVIPTLLSWNESLICFDPKGENWQITSGYRSKLGTCIYFDPTSRSSARFNPLMEIRNGETQVKDTQNVADILVDPDGKIETRNHWQNAAHSLLVGTILYVIYYWPQKSLSGVVNFLTRPNHSFEDVLKLMAECEHGLVNSIAQEMLNKHEEERSGVLSTAVSLLSVFRDPLVANATDGHDFSIASLKKSDKPVSLYLVLPPSDLSRLRVLLRIMLNQIGRILMESGEYENKNGHRVLFLLDEFPALGRLEFFESALGYMAGYGLKAFLIVQSLNQLQKAYGDKNSIMDNCHIRVVFANNDDQTARRISDLLGEQTLKKEQESYSGSRFSMLLRNTSVSQITFGRPLMLPSEINRLPHDEEIILCNGTLPILAKKIRYYEDARFTGTLCAAPVFQKAAQQIKQDSFKETAPSFQKHQIGSAL